MDEQEKWKRDADEIKRISSELQMDMLRQDPHGASEWGIHLLFDHYLIWREDLNAFVVSKNYAESFQDKVNDLIRKVIESQREQS